jgi:hypothetical protein
MAIASASGAIGSARQRDRARRGVIDVGEQPRLRHFPADDVPGRRDERFLAERGDAGWCRKAIEEGEEPFAAAVVAKALDLRKVQRQVMGQEAVQDLGLGLGDRLVRLRELLQVVEPVQERIVVALGQPGAQQV